VSAWQALFWGAFTASSLLIGALLARSLANRRRVVAHAMAFGAGTLVSAIAYELVPESSLSHGLGLGIAFALGAAVYYTADRIIDGRGGKDRQKLDPAQVDEGSGAAMFLGALLDGIPESYVLGTTLAAGGGIDAALVAAVFVANVPEGIAGTTSLRAAGYSSRRVYVMWTSLAVVSGLMALAGYLFARTQHVDGLYSQAFAAGAVLTMLTDSMIPESYEHGGRSVGLTVVAGYLVAAALSALD
jgi:zinc transporter, ZIP family